MRCISGLGASLISIFLALFAVGCGGGSGNGGGNPQSPINVAGNWQASTNSNLGYNTFLSVRSPKQMTRFPEP
jgi:hypothetical protein